MKTFLPFFILLLSFTATAQNAEWVRSISSISTAGSEASDRASHHFVDSKGNIYLVGTFRGAWLHIGTTTLTNTLANYSEIFIIKYDSLGAVLWARSVKGHNSEILIDVELDTFDNLYLTGHYNSSR